MSLVSKLRSVVSHAKDAGASAAIEHLLAKRLEPYGELKSLRLNSREKTIEIEVLLKGESEPLAVKVLQYELQITPEQDFLVVKRAIASREWVTALLQDFVVGRPQPLPHQHSKMVRLVLNG